MNVITRFAPSPTGFMHIGGVRTALFAWLWARKNGGTFILRIEDTDQKREVEGSIAHIQESLSWLGIDWDFGPDKAAPFGSCIQSERLETYRAAAHKLIDKGLAYPDPYTVEELTAFREKADAEKRPFLFREHRPLKTGPWDGTTPLRFKVPEIKSYSWHDEVRGDLSAGQEALDDFILIKGDAYPTYNFAHVVDDEAMGVTHILRGDEFISSTPRFLSLYDALEIPYPKFVTLPPILREDKTKKLGKRDGAKDIFDYRSEGYLPGAMRNFLALIGWNPGTEQELFDTEQLLQLFDISQIQVHGGVFNEEKLRWFNREYIQMMSPDAFSAYALPILKKGLEARGIAYGDIAKTVVSHLHTSIHTSSDIEKAAAEGEFDFIFIDPKPDSSRIPQKGVSVADTIRHLERVKKLLSETEDAAFSEPERIKAAIWEYAGVEGRGAVLWPMRYALTGREKSPDPFEVSAMIGKEVALRRINAALAQLSNV